MSQFLCLTIVLLFAVVINVQAQIMAEETEKFMADIASCKNETGASDADVEDLYNRKLPANRAAKCFNKCMFTKLEIFKDGKLSQDGLVKIVEMDKSDLRGKDGRSLAESMKDILDECSKVVDADTCELAAKLRICLNAAAKKREFCPNVF